MDSELLERIEKLLWYCRILEQKKGEGNLLQEINDVIDLVNTERVK